MERLIRTRALGVFFVLAAITFAITAGFHVRAYLGGEPTARHLVFVGSNLVFVALCLGRPRAFPYFATVVTAQQLGSHGGDALRRWRETGSFAAMDVAICLFMLALTAAAWRDWRDKASASDTRTRSSPG